MDLYATQVSHYNTNKLRLFCHFTKLTLGHVYFFEHPWVMSCCYLQLGYYCHTRREENVSFRFAGPGPALSHQQFIQVSPHLIIPPT